MRTPRLLFLSTVIALAAAALPAQNKHQEFRDKFKSAVDLKDSKAQVKVLKSYAGEAIHYFKGLVDAYARNGDSKSYEAMEQLKPVFKEAWESDVLSNIERHRVALDRKAVESIFKLVTQQNQAWALFESAKKSKKENEFRQAMSGMQQIAERLEEYGAKLEAAKAWLLHANIVDGFKGRNRGDTEAMVNSMRRYLQLHKDWDWAKGRDYATNVAYSRGLEARLKDPKKDEEAKKNAGGKGATGNLKYKAGSKWESVKFEHKLLKKPHEGICLYSGTNPIGWFGITLQGTDPQEIKWFKDGKLFVQRTAASKFQNPLTEQGIGKKARVVKFGGTKKPTELWYDKVDSDGEKYEINYGWFIYVPSSQEAVVSSQMNMAPQWQPQNKSALLYMRSASTFVAKVNGVELTMYDENSTGTVGDKVGDMAMNDQRFASGEETVRHEVFDTMKIGKGKVVPYSPYVKLGEDWYALKVLRNNEVLRYRALDKVETGMIAVDWKGSKKAKPRYLVVRETSGAWGGAAFDLMANKGKPVEVPAGKYEVLYGRVVNGKAPRLVNAVVQKGESKAIEVKGGETASFAIGAPFVIEFTPQKDGDKVEVSSRTLWVKDRGGLKYTCFANEILEPTLLAAKDTKGKGKKAIGDWRRMAGQDLDNARKNYEKMNAISLAYYPINAATAGSPRLEVKGRNPHGASAYWGVAQKKHKLFGKLVPLWK